MARFMSNRNTSFKKEEKAAPIKNNNPYYKLLDWTMPDLDLQFSDPEHRYVKQAVILHHGLDMSADSWFFDEDPDDSGQPIPI